VISEEKNGQGEACKVTQAQSFSDLRNSPFSSNVGDTGCHGATEFNATIPFPYCIIEGVSTAKPSERLLGASPEYRRA
jgi:hypothetical protein